MKDLMEIYKDGKIKAFVNDGLTVWVGSACTAFEDRAEMVSFRNILTQIIDNGEKGNGTTKG